MSKQELELAKARAALERGNLRRAVRHAWTAGVAAVQARDEEHLEAVLELAAGARERSSGRLHREAEQLFVYCTSSLADARAGVLRSSSFGGLFRLGAAPANKTCPDCAETVKAAARVCRFCGHRFDEP
ncbi:MAG: zinc ribbon domain-containing protein [Gaiellaceae bacterium]